MFHGWNYRPQKNKVMKEILPYFPGLVLFLLSIVLIPLHSAVFAPVFIAGVLASLAADYYVHNF